MSGWMVDNGQMKVDMNEWMVGGWQRGWKDDEYKWMDINGWMVVDIWMNDERMDDCGYGW